MGRKERYKNDDGRGEGGIKKKSKKQNKDEEKEKERKQEPLDFSF